MLLPAILTYRQRSIELALECTLPRRHTMPRVSTFHTLTNATDKSATRGNNITVAACRVASIQLAPCVADAAHVADVAARAIADFAGAI